MNPQESDNFDFDFDGRLALCRGLWRLAEQAVTTDADRQAARGVVMQTWKGRFATETTASMRTAYERRTVRGRHPHRGAGVGADLVPGVAAGGERPLPEGREHG